MSFLIVLSLIVLLLLAIKVAYWTVAFRNRAAKWRQFPGPDASPFIGDVNSFKEPSDILPTGLKYMKEYGLTYRVQLGLQHFIFTGDPRLNEIVTTSQIHLSKSLAIKYLRHWLGEGLITTDNPRWKVHRRLITPTFHFKIIEDFVPIINRNCKNLVKHIKDNRSGEQFNVYDDILLCSLDAICETAMGLSIHALRDGTKSNYVASIKYMGEWLMYRTFSYWKQYDFLYNMTPERKVELKMLQHMRDITYEVIRRRSADFKQRKKKIMEDNSRRKKRVAFLDRLLLSLEENGGFMTDEQLREEVDTFIFAGHDTVASAIAFALHFLSKNENIQQRVYEEIEQVYGTKDELIFENLVELKYLDLVIKETLRLCPSVPIHSRIVAEDIHFDGKVIPKGAHVVLFLYGSHRNEKLFPDPETFNPERFLDEEFVKNSLFGYIPFNAGPRNCIGQKYAVTTMKCMLSILLKEYKFIRPKGFEIQPVAEAVLKSKNGVYVTVESRWKNNVK